MSRDEPSPGLPDEAAHWAAYLDFLRDTVIERCTSLPEAEQRRPQVPSGWAPLELLWHLAHMERRWLVWGFLGEPVADPWGDSGGAPDGRWLLPAATSVEEVATMLRAGGRRTTQVLTTASLTDTAATTGRFAGEEPPDLRWICFHVLQEYARHAGHLDVAVEVAGGPTGE